jgi:hypothetical protein
LPCVYCSLTPRLITLYINLGFASHKFFWWSRFHRKSWLCIPMAKLMRHLLNVEPPYASANYNYSPCRSLTGDSQLVASSRCRPTTDIQISGRPSISSVLFAACQKPFNLRRTARKLVIWHWVLYKSSDIPDLRHSIGHPMGTVRRFPRIVSDQRSTPYI